jgi:hypothetical protein
MLNIISRLEARKKFRELNIKIDTTDTLLMSELSPILTKYNILKNEAMISRLALLISSGIYQNMLGRFEELALISVAPSKRRLEIIFVDPEIVKMKHAERMLYKEKKRRYTLKQFFLK